MFRFFFNIIRSAKKYSQIIDNKNIFYIENEFT